MADDSTKRQQATHSISEIESQIRTRDRQIFLELLRLAEYNVKYQQTVNHYARWHKVTYPLAQEAGYACFLGFSVSDISQRARGWNDPSLISATTTKRALAAATVGASLGATSSLLELVTNGAEAIRASRKGFSEREAVSFVQSTVTRVDELIASRHALMNTGDFTDTRRELLELKEQLLKYERDRLVFEFKRWSAHSRGFTWYKNTFYVINATVNLGRLSAVQLGFKSFTEPKCSAGTGPILTTSAFLAGIGPAASSQVGNYIQRRQERLLTKKFPKTTLLSEQEAKQKFERLAQLLTNSDTSNQHGQLVAELLRLREEKFGLDRFIFQEERKIGRYRRVAGQQAVTAPMISSLGATSGIINTVGYYGYRGQPVTSNKLGLAGDATVIPAEVIALVATPTAALKTYLYERDLKNKGEHPDQLLSKRLRDLEALRELVSGSWR